MSTFESEGEEAKPAADAEEDDDDARPEDSY
jgi:hypothetical protein